MTKKQKDLVIPLSSTDLDILLNQNENYTIQTPPLYKDFAFKFKNRRLIVKSANLIWLDPYHKFQDTPNCTIDQFESSETPFGISNDTVLMNFFTDITYENVPEIAGYQLPNGFARLQIDEQVMIKDLDHIAANISDNYKNAIKYIPDNSDSFIVEAPITIHTYDYDFAEWVTIDENGDYLEENQMITDTQQDAMSNYFFDRGIPKLTDSSFRNGKFAYLEITLYKQ